MTRPETYLSFPFALTPEGSVATVDESDHVRQRIEQILFTSAGERVMLPSFGASVRDLLFSGNDAALAAAAEFRIARSLQSHLGRQVMINAVDVRNDDEKLVIEVVFTRSRDRLRERATFEVTPTRTEFERGGGPR